MPRRSRNNTSGRTPTRPKRPQRRNGSALTIPFVSVIKEGTTATYTLSSILPSGQTPYWQGVPWRITHVSYSVSVSFDAVYTTSSAQPINIFPGSAIFQMRLNSALANNVENVSSIRRLVSTTPVRGTLHMRRPNTWKEDEERSQNFLYIDNVQLSDGRTSTLTVLSRVYVVFGPMVFSQPSSLRIFYHTNHNREPDPDEDPPSLEVLSIT